MTIPDRLKKRPLYGGYVVPYSVVVADGIPDFRVTDMTAWAECITRGLCAICGERLDYWAWYIGGKVCTDTGVYFDLAMHEECCFYAASVCPFLAGRDYSTATLGRIERAGYAVDTHHNTVKATVLYASKRRRDQVTVIQDGGGLLVQTGPEIKRVQIWPKP